MTGQTHYLAGLIVGAGSDLVVTAHWSSPGGRLLALGVGAVVGGVAALAPDLDLPRSKLTAGPRGWLGLVRVVCFRSLSWVIRRFSDHRGFTHNPLAPYLPSGLLCLVLMLAHGPHELGRVLVFPFIAGWWSHLLLDAQRGPGFISEVLGMVGVGLAVGYVLAAQGGAL